MDWNKDIILINEYGGVFDDKFASDLDRDHLKDTYNLFDNLNKRLLIDSYIDSKSDLQLVITNQNKTSATIAKRQNSHAIWLSIGTIRAIWNLLILSLCDPNVLPGYHNDKKINYKPIEKINRSLLFGQSIIPSYNHDIELHSTSLLVYQNITDSRLELCTMIFNWIIDYILYHEAMHVTRDHLSLLSIFNNVTSIDEVKVLGENNSSLPQLFEIDADITALSYNIESHPEIREFTKLKMPAKKDFFFLQTFGFLIVQQLFDLEYEEICVQIKGDHPPPVFRAILWSNLLRQYFKRYKMPDKIILDQQNKAWYEASMIAIKLGFPDGRWHGDNMKDVSFDLINQVIDEYNIFKDIIDKDDNAQDYGEFKKYIKIVKPMRN